MQKEIEPIQQLEARRDSLSKGIGRIRDVYLSDPVRIGKVEAGSSVSISFEVGRTKTAARKAVVALGNKLEEVDNDLRANDEARDYLHKVNEMERGLPKIRELVAEGNLPEDILRKHQQEFEELQKLPENNPLLKRAIERIRQDEEAKKTKEVSPKVEVEEKAEEKELEPGMFKLPDGKLVRLSEKEQSYIPLIPTNKDEAIPNSTLVTNIYREELENGEIDLRIALSRGNALRSVINKRRLNPVGWEIKNAAPKSVVGKRGNIEAKLYLAPISEGEQPEQQQEESPKEEPPTQSSVGPTTESLETPEFGTLSKVDVALIAQSLEFNRDRLEALLGERGVRLIEEDALFELIGLIEGKDIELKEAYYEGRMSTEEFNQLMNEYRARAFEKAREMLKDPSFGENVDRIGDQNPNVWGLFVNLSEINEVIEKSGHEEGISLLAQNPEVLKDVLESPENGNAAIEDDSTIVFEAPVPVEGIEPVEPKPSALERRDPEIRAIINQYLDRILEIPELNGPVSPPLVTRSFESIKKPFIDHALEEGWISAIIDKNHRDRLDYDPAAIATLLYLHRKEDKLPSRLKRKVQEIAQEEYRKRLKEKENNK